LNGDKKEKTLETKEKGAGSSRHGEDASGLFSVIKCWHSAQGSRRKSRGEKFKWKERSWAVGGATVHIETFHEIPFLENLGGKTWE